MDEAADCFGDICATVSDLFNEGFDDDNVGIVELCGNVRSSAAGVVLTGSHRRLQNGANEAALGVCYDGMIGDTEFTLETTTSSEDPSKLGLTITNPFGFEGNTVTILGELDTDGGDEADSLTVEWVRETDNLTTSLRAQQTTELGEGLQISPAAIFSWNDLTLGLEALYDGGSMEFLRFKAACARTVEDLSLSFWFGRNGPPTKEATYTFEAGATYEASETCQVGGQLTRNSGEPAELSIGLKHTLDDTIEIKHKLTNMGVYSLLATIALSANVTAVLLIQQARGSEMARGGLSLSYEDAGKEINEEAAADADDAGDE
eukprot:TRINITY_DN603_c6_g1_i1.p1 TRINITY_DN603_c6_g1~~TRINITY_DN603_c6_g1_i1.p1  ORF type:complete len:338 (+),score=91.12 TRINITY_DN603_c6_g1_i1:58-1014(+)